MSGVEVVGILASTAQLITYILRISTYFEEICRKVQGAGQEFKKHNGQIKQLTVIAEDVKRHPLLQTDAIHSHVKALLVDAETLCTILDQAKAEYGKGLIRKVLWAIKGHRERDILIIVERLEREKSSLVLAINIIQLNVSVALGDKFSNMQAGSDGIKKDSTTTVFKRPKIYHHGPMPSGTVSLLVWHLLLAALGNVAGAFGFSAHVSKAIHPRITQRNRRGGSDNFRQNSRIKQRNRRKRSNSFQRQQPIRLPTNGTFDFNGPG